MKEYLRNSWRTYSSQSNVYDVFLKYYNNIYCYTIFWHLMTFYQLFYCTVICMLYCLFIGILMTFTFH